MSFRGSMRVLGLLLLAGLASEARADVLTYSVTGTFADGGVLSGTFTLYPGYAPNVNLTINDPAAPARFFTGSSRTLAFGGYPNQDPAGFYPDGLFFNQVPYQPALTLYVPFASPLMNYPGGPLCSDTTALSLCTSSLSGGKDVSSLSFPNSSVYAHDGYTVDLTSGLITLVSGTIPSTVPEPASVVFVASGLLGLAGAARRRLKCFAAQGERAASV